MGNIPLYFRKTCEMVDLRVMKCKELKLTDPVELTEIKIVTKEDEEKCEFRCFRCDFQITNLSDYLCDSCGYRSTTFSNCVQHHRLHHELRDGYLCTICGYTTWDVSSTESHEKSHRKRKLEEYELNETAKRIKATQCDAQTQTNEKETAEIEIQTDFKAQVNHNGIQTDEKQMISRITQTDTNHIEISNVSTSSEIRSEFTNIEMRKLSDLFCTTLMNMSKQDANFSCIQQSTSTPIANNLMDLKKSISTENLMENNSKTEKTRGRARGRSRGRPRGRGRGTTSRPCEKPTKKLDPEFNFDDSDDESLPEYDFLSQP